MPATTTVTDTLTELLAHLVRFPTLTADQATSRAALDWVEQQLAGLPLTIKRFNNRGYASLVATTPAVRDPKNPKLWLAAHMDVVGGESTDFEPRVADGRLYGRGTHDMKFALATYIALLQDLGGNLTNYDLGLLITTDEEIGGEHGVSWLVNKLGYRGGAVLLPDSSTPGHLEAGAKGLVHYNLTAAGQAAHASRTWQGVNAVDEIMRFVDNVRAHVPTEPCGDSAHNHPTVSLTTIQGGLAFNQIPGTATATLDLRFPPTLTSDEVASWIAEAATAIPTVTATKVDLGEPYSVQPNAAIDAFQAAAVEVFGHELPRNIAHGSSDARFFTWKGVPTLNAGVIGSGYHVSPEWVDLTDLTRFYSLTRRFAEVWAKS